MSGDIFGECGDVLRQHIHPLERFSMQGHGDLLASRVREIRAEKFGTDGVASLAKALNIAAPTWENFENGVLIPGWILLQFIALTGVEPVWLLTGKGDRYRVPPVKLRRGASR
jgi:hypothetical protein